MKLLKKFICLPLFTLLTATATAGSTKITLSSPTNAEAAERCYPLIIRFLETSSLWNSQENWNRANGILSIDTKEKPTQTAFYHCSIPSNNSLLNITVRDGQSIVITVLTPSAKAALDDSLYQSIAALVTILETHFGDIYQRYENLDDLIALF